MWGYLEDIFIEYAEISEKKKIIIIETNTLLQFQSQIIKWNQVISLYCLILKQSGRVTMRIKKKQWKYVASKFSKFNFLFQKNSERSTSRRKSTLVMCNRCKDPIASVNLILRIVCTDALETCIWQYHIVYWLLYTENL